MIVRNGKFGGKSPVKFRRLFMDVVNHRATGAASERNVKPRELRIRANRINFYSAIAQIAYVSGETQTFRNVLREITETNSLHHA